MNIIKNETLIDTFDLSQAANFLHMSTSALRAKVKAGEVKAAKPAKKWVFLYEDLVDYIRSLYYTPVEIPQSGSQMENKLCHYLNAEKHTGLMSQHQMDKEYVALLELKTKN